MLRRSGHRNDNVDLRTCHELPFNMIMKKRDPYHYLNMNERTATPLGRIKAGGEAICFNEGLFGVLGAVKGKDGKRGTVKLEINKDREVIRSDVGADASIGDDDVLANKHMIDRYAQ